MSWWQQRCTAAVAGLCVYTDQFFYWSELSLPEKKYFRSAQKTAHWGIQPDQIGCYQRTESVTVYIVDNDVSVKIAVQNSLHPINLL